MQLSRARELRRAGEWDLERLSPDYAPKQELAITIPELVLRFGQKPAAFTPTPAIEGKSEHVQTQQTAESMENDEKTIAHQGNLT